MYGTPWYAAMEDTIRMAPERRSTMPGKWRWVSCGDRNPVFGVRNSGGCHSPRAVQRPNFQHVLSAKANSAVVQNLGAGGRRPPRFVAFCFACWARDLVLSKRSECVPQPKQRRELVKDAALRGT